MVVVPLLKQENGVRVEPVAEENEELNWAGFAAGSALIAGGLLLLSGRRRAGIVAASAGTALALLDQQETLRSWWHTLPSYIDEVQRTLTQVQNAVNDLAAKRETLHRILAR
jgi:hypothetical protein